MPVTVQDLRAWKAEGRRFAMLTAYDYPTARILDEAGIPVLLVGDTLAEVVLGHDTTLPVTMDAMVHHCQAVTRGAGNALVVGDKVYTLETKNKSALDSLNKLAGEQATVTGKLNGETIEVSSVASGR